VLLTFTFNEMRLKSKKDRGYGHFGEQRKLLSVLWLKMFVSKNHTTDNKPFLFFSSEIAKPRIVIYRAHETFSSPSHSFPLSSINISQAN
jgi:hypothetical protein